MTLAPFVLLDSADTNRGRLYQDLRSIDYLHASELDRLDDCLADGWAKGHHNVLSLPYEFGRDLMGISDQNAAMTCAWYAQRSEIDDVAALLARQQIDDAPAGIIAPNLTISEAAYHQAIAQIHEHIRAGDAYQINFTTQCEFAYYGHPIALYRALRRAQPAPYAALIYHGEDHWTLSLSPERFFSVENQHLVSEPMKGTAPIVGDGQDDARAAALAKDEKNRAENLMIVDLLRNDVSKIAKPFSVHVVNPFAVKAHGKVWQMTSEVHADLQENTSAAAIIRALFPCGSITGAPKAMAMQLIDQLEGTPRGLYTGSIGYIDPDGSSCFNIAIRSAELSEHGGRIGVGSGITIDSTAHDEYQECHWKIAFLQHPPQPFTLFETLYATERQIALLPEHLARLSRSAHELGFRFDARSVTQALENCLANLNQSDYRIKISLAQDGSTEVRAHEYAGIPTKVGVVVHEETLSRRDPLRRYKTSQRAVYDRAWQQAAAHGAFDGLVFNEAGILLEGGRSSVFLLLDGRWHTPDLALDILPGVMRGVILANPQRYLNTERVYESHLTRADLARAERMVICNALRGVLDAVLC
ncbi:aminodeoxychorismate synthase component I [Suttonella sp. R2A3]|uniref:aminodeoxychorismate synthase component I n=1 Tax=Suttonella sp. R2A3 TaxID=2908648 RepID=UPI001F45163A|nr:aminodeoxychorismate synthase component I [Suttonella sp. R2A3]UJF24201.1 aminodeoxychorismate synthase component I [Suttonella sp. R2A3]